MRSRLRILLLRERLRIIESTQLGTWTMHCARAISRIAFLPESDGLETEFRKLSRLPSRSPKVWADAYLLAFASVAGVRLVTFDRALQSRSTEVLVL